jgi:oxygen-independent coproporphyrinogen-3 oxidase
VFVGGGTPSLWEPSELGRVLERLSRHVALDPEVEVTVECNPSSFSDERARQLRAIGVNRISLGVQGLERERLEFLGRLHDGPRALSSVRQAVDAGLPSVSADLIYGVYGQLASRAALEAGAVADAGVGHLSAYALTIEPATAFGARAKRGTLPLLPDDVVAESFTAVHEALEARGLRHYEISNFARPGHECRHNLGYWRGEPYLGLGTGAWGTLPRGSRGLRYRNTPSAERYLALKAWPDPSPEIPDPAYHSSEWLDPETRLSERLLLGLRLAEGLDPEQVERELGIPFLDDDRARAIDQLLTRGELALVDGRLRIPLDAWLFADRVIRGLL